MNPIFSLITGILPDIIKRVLPAEKISETEQAQLAQAVQLELMKQDWAAVEAEYKDRADARSLAGQEVAKGNAFTATMAAVVRPLWGIGAFALIAYSVVQSAPISLPLQSIVETVLMFYFGGRTIEKLAPLAAQVLKK